MKDPESQLAGGKHENFDIILPVQKRVCTDKIFLVLIICCWIVMTIIGFCSTGLFPSAYIKKGNPQLLLHGVDYMGNICSVDDPVKSLPYIIMPNAFGTTVSSTGAAVPPLFGICVATCPNEGDIVTDPYGTYGTWKISYDTQNFLNSCLYINIPNIDNTSGTTLLSDFIRSYKIIAIFGFILSIVFSFLFLLVIRVPLILRTIVWSCIWLILALLSAGAYVMLTKAKDEITKNRGDAYTENNTEILLLKVIGGIMTAFAVLWLCVICFMRKRIALAISLIKESSVALLSMPLLCLLPFIQTLIFATFTLIWLVYSIYLVSSGDIDTVTDSTTGFSYKTINYNKHAQEAIVFLLFIWFWSVGYLEAIGQIIVSHVILVWYFAVDRGLITSTQVWNSTLYCGYYHSGTAAFGSLLIAILRLLRMVLEYIKMKLMSNARIVGNTQSTCCSYNCLIRYVLCCIGCVMWCFEKCIKFLNKHAYIQVAMFGTSFLMSAKRAYFIILRNLGRLATISVIGDFVVFIGKVSITLTCSAVAYLYFSRFMSMEMNSILLPTVFIGFIAYVTSTLFLGILSATSDSMLQAVIVDEELSLGVANIKYKGLRDLVILQQNEFRALNCDDDNDDDGQADDDAEAEEVGADFVEGDVEGDDEEDEEEVVHFHANPTAAGASGPRRMISDKDSAGSADETTDMLGATAVVHGGVRGTGATAGQITNRLRNNSSYRNTLSAAYAAREQEQQSTTSGGVRRFARGQSGSLWSDIKNTYIEPQQQFENGGEEEEQVSSPLAADENASPRSRYNADHRNNSNGKTGKAVELRVFGGGSTGGGGNAGSGQNGGDVVNRYSPQTRPSPTSPAAVAATGTDENSRYNRYRAKTTEPSAPDVTITTNVSADVNPPPVKPTKPKPPTTAKPQKSGPHSVDNSQCGESALRSSNPFDDDDDGDGDVV